MTIMWLPRAAVFAIALGAGAASAQAQQAGCPPGYYFASDGRCYPAPQAYYPQPVYVTPAPVYQPPFVLDGFNFGIDLGGGRHRYRR